MKVKKLLCFLLTLSITAALIVGNVVTASAIAVYYVGTSYSLEEIFSGRPDSFDQCTDITYKYKANAEGVPTDDAHSAAPAEIVFEHVGTYEFGYKTDPALDATYFDVLVEAAPAAGPMTRISGVTYNVEDILEAKGFEKLDGQSTYRGGRTVKYRLAVNASGVAVAEGDNDYLESTETSVESTIEFKNCGTYIVNVYTGEDEAAVFETSFQVIVKRNVTAADPDYNKTSVTYGTDFTQYLNKVAENSENLVTGDSFNVPSLEAYISSADFAYDTLQKKVYYCAPDSTSYTQGSTVTTSDASFTVNKLGKYSYYVLFEDAFGNAMTTDKLVMGEGGWYKTVDGDGKTATGNVVIPVFTFEVVTVKAPEVSVKASDNAYVGLSYEVKAFNIVSDEYNTVYKLYFSETYFDKDSDAYANDGEYMAAVTAVAKDVTEDLNTSSLTFTPDKSGYYYAQVKVVDSYNNEEVAMSRAIACKGEARYVQPDPEFFKNNVTSIVFLSIAGVCFVAIIVLLLIKPKQDNTVEVEEQDK